MLNNPIPENEMERIISLADYDLDYTSFQDSFKDLAKLAAKVAGTEISLINLIDSFTQWTITSHGLDIDQMPREDSVCQYTIAGNNDHFEVQDLKADDRFKDKFYVTDKPNLRYYYGIPLTTNEGHNLGALCMLDKDLKTLSPEKIELLKIIVDEIVNRLNVHRLITCLKTKLHEANETKMKVAHDIRGPLGGIIGLAQVISEQGHENKIEEVLEFINLIQRSGRSLLELADEILTADKPQRDLKTDEFNLIVFKDKLEKLYTPQAMNKKIAFTVSTSVNLSTIPFSKNKLLQITGNLISNAMKFTPISGKVTVVLSLKIEETQNLLQINVTDTGVGLSLQAVETILSGKAQSTDGTSGEQGYGFGLALVKHLVDSLKGTMHIYSNPGNGANFEIVLPQVQA
ncbi:GAF domain-containing sensor histidine kinase [Mucilaginibacter sp. RB4R14]|uniref:GAF domain-containing sensor histidine kinase n=1 Tax=Mucilaginibacter aurantiaciroseus TaxID=2949308 RepID=UPI002091292F|nr:GAF domain-containing sensor histidine kinase [Mucilaginibacter aurantiaciroseus]MCO5934368.1 GAF domain-containing sensor histidine kinase [Mucilaginibacter aurantiaciroseus]